MKAPKKYSQFLTLGISLLLLANIIHNIVEACSGGDPVWEEDPQVFMQPDVLNDYKNEPYYFCMNFLNGGKPDTTSLNRNELVKGDMNTQSWYLYFKGRISDEAIFSFLYESPAFTYTTTPRLQDFIAQFDSFALIAYLKKYKRNDVLHYLMLAKANEFNTPENGWNSFPSYDAYGTDSIQEESPLVDLSDQLIKALKQERNTFLQQRLAFQLMRYYRYAYKPSGVDSLFMLHFEPHPEHPLYADALKYACDALVNNNQQVKANYYAARLFHHPQGNKWRAYNNLGRSTPINEVLLQCRSSAEQSMVYVLYAFRDYHPNAVYIKKAVTLDPGNTNINDLLVRELNKVDYKLLPTEQQYNFWRWTGNSSDGNDPITVTDEEGNVTYTYPQHHENNTVLQQLFVDLRGLNNQHEPFYTLCLAHLALIENNVAAAGNWLSMINEHKLGGKLRLQYHLTGAIYHIRKNNLRSAEAQQQLYLNLQYLQQHENDYYYNLYVSNAVKLLATEKLINDGDRAHAYLLADDIRNIYYSYNLFHRTLYPQDIDTIIGLMHHPVSDFERMITTENAIKETELRDIQGSLYLRQNDVVNANKSYALSDNSYEAIHLAKLNTNPDGHPCYPYLYAPLSPSELEYYTQEDIKQHNERTKQYYLPYNNYTITRTILALKDKIRKKEGDLAAHYYYLASLYMEISYYGRFYQALQFDDSWSWYEYEDAAETDNHEPFKDHYYGCAWAIPYYELALQHSKNRELTARCLYALFRCNRHQQRYLNKESKEDINYLYRLHDGYANTAYYRIKECWGLSAYVKELRQQGN